MNIMQQPSPNFNERKGGQVPRFIMFHYTDTENLAATFGFLCNPATELSAHYVVDVDGAVYQLVAEAQRAWHAGMGSWQGITDMNSASVGIEIQNPGHSYGLQPFTTQQLTAVQELCLAIQQRWQIPPANVIGHSDYAPGRKVDPGPLFPWQEFAKLGVGRWPRADFVLAHQPSLPEMRAALMSVGYGLGENEADFMQVISAFQLHYHPEAQGEWPNAETIRRLFALLV